MVYLYYISCLRYTILVGNQTLDLLFSCKSVMAALYSTVMVLQHSSVTLSWYDSADTVR